MIKYNLAIVIVNWNSRDYLRNCITSIYNSNLHNFKIQIIIIDNCSSDNSTANIIENENLLIIRNKENVGFGAACNMGASKANSNYLLFLNPDVTLHKNTISISLKLIKEEGYSVLGLKQVNESGRLMKTCARKPKLYHVLNQSIGLTKLSPSLFPSYKMLEWNHQENKDVYHVIGSYYLVLKSDFDLIGGFDCEFFLYYEDFDLSLRLKSINKSIHYYAGETITHAGGGVSKQIMAKRLYFSQKSKLLFFKKHFSLINYVIVFISITVIEFFVRFSISILKFDKKGLKELISAYKMLYKSFT